MQKISVSTLMDGEEINSSTLRKVTQDPELEKAWQNFHLIRDVMRKESDFILGDDFTKSVAAALELEDTPILESQEKIEPKQKNFWRKLKPALMPMLQLGVAASVCLVAVFGVQQFTKKPAESAIPVLQTLPFNNQVQDVSYNVPHQFIVTPKQMEEKNKQIGEMVQSYELQRRLYASEIHK